MNNFLFAAHQKRKLRRSRRGFSSDQCLSSESELVLFPLACDGDR